MARTRTLARRIAQVGVADGGRVGEIEGVLVGVWVEVGEAVFVGTGVLVNVNMDIGRTVTVIPAVASVSRETKGIEFEFAWQAGINRVKIPHIISTRGIIFLISQSP